MIVLYIVAEGIISPKASAGGGIVYYEQLYTLHQLGHEIHLWHIASHQARHEFDHLVKKDPATWENVQGMCKSVTLTTLASSPSLLQRGLARFLNMLSEVKVANPIYRMSVYRKLLGLISQKKIDLIWAQHFRTAQFAVLQRRCPVIYSHHDWLYRVKSFVNTTNEDLQKREEEVARRSSYVVAGSWIEAEELHAIGCNYVDYIPVSYSEPPENISESVPQTTAKIVHLGSMNTTASRLGLERFFEVVWDNINRSVLQDLLIIGDASNASEYLKRKFTSEGIRLLGYVPDLNDVLSPYDIHIIPWEHATGQRTRLPLAMSYRQVIVACANAVAGYPEAVDQVNCRLVNGLEDMAQVINELLEDTDQRKHLGDAAWNCFQTNFSQDALLERYRKVINHFENHAI